jgi:nitroreductase
VAGDKKPYCQEVRKLLGLPENYKLVSFIAIGYADTEPNPVKKPLSEVMHWEKYVS